MTACKPISDNDLANYLALIVWRTICRWNRVLPIGGPGEAITPRQQGGALVFIARPSSHVSVQVPLALLYRHVLPPCSGHRRPGSAAAIADKAELARIGRYYATESMLVLNPETGRYEADATPSTGTETLFDFYRSLVAGDAPPERGDHAVF